MIRRPALILDDMDVHGDAATDAKTEVVWVSPDETTRLTFNPYAPYDDNHPLLDHALAITGRALDVAQHWPCFPSLLPHLAVYARVSPGQKEFILTSLKDLNLMTLMCGDGTNDVGALKQSAVGVALLDGRPDDLAKILRAYRQRQLQKARAEMLETQRAMYQRMGQPVPPQLLQQGPSPGGSVAAMAEGMGVEEEMPMIKLGDASVAAPFTSKISTINAGTHPTHPSPTGLVDAPP